MGTAMRRFVVTGVVVLVVVVGVATYLGPIAPVATGYAAKITCSAALLADRPAEDAKSDLPSNPLVPLLRTEIAADEDRVTSSLLGLWDSTAWYTPGLGCTLAERDPGFEPLVPASPRSSDQPWPAGAGVDIQAARTETSIEGAELDQVVDEAFQENNPDGQKNTRAVVVVHQGQLVAEQYAPGFDADTPLLGWSMGKSIANAIIGRLVREGQLRRDMDNLRPEWRATPRAEITVNDLLRMRSGLVFDETYDPNTDATNMLFLPGSTADFAAAKPLEADPGTWWSYSSGATNILCDVAAETAGMGPEMARELVFDPLGMDSAVIEPDASGGLVCSSFAYATARDWARFGQLYLNGGSWDGEQLFTSEWVGLTTAAVELQTENPYGAHWWLNSGPDGTKRMPDVPADAFWASGNEGQQLVVVPSADLVVVRLGFTSDFDGIEWGLEDLVSGVIGAIPGASGGDGPGGGASGDSAEVVTPSPTGTATPGGNGGNGGNGGDGGNDGGGGNGG